MTETHTDTHRPNNAGRVMSAVLGREVDPEHISDEAAAKLLLDATGRTIYGDEENGTQVVQQYEHEELEDLYVEFDEELQFPCDKSDVPTKLVQSAIGLILLAAIIDHERAAGIVTALGEKGLPTPVEGVNHFIWKWSATWPHTAWIMRAPEGAPFHRSRFLIDSVVFPNGTDDESIASAVANLMTGKLGALSQDPDPSVQRLLKDTRNVAERRTTVYLRMPLGDKCDLIFREMAMMKAAAQFVSMGFVPEATGMHRLPPAKDQSEPMLQYVLKREQRVYADDSRHLLGGVALVGPKDFDYTGS